jgi:hypothetical protein
MDAWFSEGLAAYVSGDRSGEHVVNLWIDERGNVVEGPMETRTVPEYIRMGRVLGVIEERQGPEALGRFVRACLGGTDPNVTLRRLLGYADPLYFWRLVVSGP